MSWAVLVPVKPPGARKRRLAAGLDVGERDALVERLLAGVLAAICAVPAAGEPLLVTDTPLNAALEAARSRLAGGPFAIVHADLPLLVAEDVAALLAAAERHGAAIAPDRHGRGTNALAIADGRAFAFAFGAGSFARHRARAPDAAIVRRDGLAFDLDEPADLALLDARAEPGHGRLA